jgi:ArsR family transcriptional regulator, arsenate/arsenite/antimonite-responsive transcriptional repressor
MATIPTDCCVLGARAPLGESTAIELADALKALADPARLRLLSLIASSEGGEACACDLVGPIERSQPTVSHHLATLVAAGFLTREKRGRWAWYRIVPQRMQTVCAAISP